MSDDWVPTPRLRWLSRAHKVTMDDSGTETTTMDAVLQCWWAQDLPSYMKRGNEEGEWRDVPMIEGEL